MVSQIIKLAVLGSTGSIGQQTLDVVRALPGRFDIIGLAAGQNIDDFAPRRDIKCRRLYDRRRQVDCRARVLSDAAVPLYDFKAPGMR